MFYASKLSGVLVFNLLQALLSPAFTRRSLLSLPLSWIKASFTSSSAQQMKLLIFALATEHMKTDGAGLSVHIGERLENCLKIFFRLSPLSTHHRLITASSSSSRKAQGSSLVFDEARETRHIVVNKSELNVTSSIENK
jgi:hypothetical protein